MNVKNQDKIAMNKGKDKCEMLRAIRRQVAEKYGLRYESTECHHEGDCLGTCPLCDAELRSLQRQLEMKGISDVVLPSVDGLSCSIEDLDVDKYRTQGEPVPDEGQVLFYDKPYQYCYIAGLSFHNIEDIWNELYLGTQLALVRQRDNKYDENAVAVALSEDYDAKDPDSFNFDFILGYIPRKDNKRIASKMDRGYEFSAEIVKLDRNASFDKRIAINIYMHDKKRKRISKRLRALSISDDMLKEQLDWLKGKGVMYFRWSSILPIEVRHNLPVKGEMVVVLHKRESDTIMYLTKVVAVGDEAVFFFDSYDEIRLIDDCSAYMLGNIAGPIVVSNWVLDFLNKEQIEERQPEKFLSQTAQTKLNKIFKI